MRLVFSEYMDENSIKNNIHVFPRMDTPLKIEFQGEEIQIDFPKDLLKNQTYILTIGRELKDEHLVPMDAPIHIAYGTGDRIDQGQISGKVFRADNASVHLWKIQSTLNSDSLVFTEPDYLTDIKDDGTYSFQYLSPGTYQILAIGSEGAGLPLDQNRVRYGMFWDSELSLTQMDSIKNVNMILHKEKPALKLSKGEWKDQTWGELTFNQHFSQALLKPTGLIQRESKSLINSAVFRSYYDSSQVIVLSDSVLFPKEKTDVIVFTKNGLDPSILDTSFITISAPNEPDTSWLHLLSPPKTVRIAPDDTTGPFVSLLFSKPTNITNPPFDIQLIAMVDTVEINSKQNWLSPMALNLIPVGGWSANSSYKLIISQDSSFVQSRDTIQDSTITISIKTLDPLGYGAVRGQVDYPWCDSCRIELISVDNSTFSLSECVNSGTFFEFNHVLEGKYHLVIYNDEDQNKYYTFGTASPRVLPERFYQLPDTISVRTNWDFELDLRSKH